MTKERFQTYSAVYLIPRRENQVLLLKRKNTGFQDGNYSLISGHLDGGESATTAMIREGKEEAGIIIERTKLKVTHISHNNVYGREYVNFFFTVRDWVGEIQNMEPDKCDDLKWFDLDNLPENIIPYIKAGILNSENGVSYSEMWE